MTNVSSPDARARVGATPGKLALIALLAVILAAVLVVQFRGAPSAADKPRARSASSANSRRTPRSVQTPVKPVSVAGDITHVSQPLQFSRPAGSLQNALQYDPFSHPAWYYPTAKIDSPGAGADVDKTKVRNNQLDRARLENLQKSRISLILTGQGGRTARLGTRFVRVGDVVEGYRVAEIGKNGIVLVDSSLP